jgi:uracil-DNA glycosylase
MYLQNISKSWQLHLQKEFKKPYFLELNNFLESEKSTYTIFPKEQDVFKAFELTPFDAVKVVILGQDPYHGLNQAHGLSFSVNKGVKVPPSLQNIFKELQTDNNSSIPTHGNLTHWAQQGVLLLNATLTVREGLPGSHQKKGWETFTDAVIKCISDEKEQIVFLLWGNYAKTKAPLIDANKHLILDAAHPSPLARGAFFGSKHFSKTNAYLISNQIKPIDWNLQEDDLFSV